MTSIFIFIILLTLIIAFIIIINNKPDFWFWLFLNFFFDPGGYISEFRNGKVFGPFNTFDVFFVGMLICVITIKFNWKKILQDTFLSKFLLFLFLFAIYYFIIYGAVIPYLYNDLNYTTFLLKNREYFYGVIILLMVYVFGLRGLSFFYSTTLFIGIICLTLYFITLFTGLKLSPIEEIARYSDDDMMRLSMLSYGIFNLLFPIALIFFLVSKKFQIKIKYKWWLYMAGLMMIVTLLITLTRRTQIDIFGTILLLVFIFSYLFRVGKVVTFLKFTLPTMLVILSLYFTFPKYINYIGDIGIDTFLLITTGKDSRGESDQRVSGSNDYELVKKYISNNLFFGTGYTYLYWTGPGTRTTSRGDTFARIKDAANEVPIYNLFFSYGLIGAILMLQLYTIMVFLFFRLIIKLKLNFIYFLKEPLTIIFSIWILLVVALKLTINFYTLSLDFTGIYMSYTGLIMGLGFALYRKLNFNLVKNG